MDGKHAGVVRGLSATDDSMSIANLIQTHGSQMIFLGILLEGETILVLGGVAAHRARRSGRA